MSARLLNSCPMNAVHVKCMAYAPTSLLEYIGMVSCYSILMFIITRRKSMTDITMTTILFSLIKKHMCYWFFIWLMIFLISISNIKLIPLIGAVHQNSIINLPRSMLARIWLLFGSSVSSYLILATNSIVNTMGVYLNKFHNIYGMDNWRILKSL
jgi:hypothetical protein